MANKKIKDEIVLHKTSIEKLPDGSCIKRTTESTNGQTVTKEEKVDCDKAMKEVHEKENKNEDNFRKGNLSFDERMREKLKDINKSFSENNKENVKTKEETYFDGKHKVVKVTRESNSIEETKKTEKIPDGTKRTLTITRESFLEETEKSVKPEEVLTEEKPESSNILDESFADEAKEDKEEEKEDNDVHEEVIESVKTEEKNVPEEMAGPEEIEETEHEIKKPYEVRFPEERMKIVEPEDGFIKKIVKTVFKILFYPLYKLNIL